MLDDLKVCVDLRSFGYGFHEGFVPFMFHSAKNHALTRTEGGQEEQMIGG
jgi:hypothetical protein